MEETVGSEQLLSKALFLQMAMKEQREKIKSQVEDTNQLNYLYYKLLEAYQDQEDRIKILREENSELVYLRNEFISISKQNHSLKNRMQRQQQSEEQYNDNDLQGENTLLKQKLQSIRSMFSFLVMNDERCNNKQ